MSVDFEKLFQQPEYEFLKTDPHLGDNIILLGLGGSHSYGTNREGSDVDFRGIAVRSAKEILLNQDWEQVAVTKKEPDVDTVIYSLNKYIELASSCNPNTIEQLGLRREDYAIIAPAGQMLLDNKRIFLSQMAKEKFGEYANSQLRRLSNKAARHVPQAEHERHILNSMLAQERIYNEKLSDRKCQYLRLYLDDAVTSGFDKEIFLDIRLTHYPLRQWGSMINDFVNIVRSYNKFGARNKKAIEHDKIHKHMMHLVRLYLTGIDILSQGDIITYREQDLPLFRSILNGDFIDNNVQPRPEFFELTNSLEKKLDYAHKHTVLPPKPDYNQIQDLHYEINKKVITG